MRILITAGPTREYLDDVRFLSNASSGRMGCELAKAALDAGHEVLLVCGPMVVEPPGGCEVHAVETTEEMNEVCLRHFPDCDGVIAAAAVCDYAPTKRIDGKIGKTGEPLVIELIETVDILAGLGRRKEHRWSVGFALESRDARARAMKKLQNKNCDAIVLNRPAAIGAETNDVELIDKTGTKVAKWTGGKDDVAAQLLAWIGERFGI